jgi:hypothetical protein
MLDGKILTAVLASLAAIGTAMNGGSIDSSDLQSASENPLGTDFGDFMQGPLGAFAAYSDNPEPDTELEAKFKINDMTDQSLKVSSAILEADNLTDIKTEKRRITSQKELSFHNYNGRIDLGKPTDLDGNAKVITTNGVNITGGFEIKEEINSKRIVLTDVERSEIKLNEVTGSVRSSSTSTNITQEALDLDINSFSGNITILPDSREIILEGRVDKLDAGSVSLD